jgi:predicted MPP superfamily phosphohydrolase
MQCYDGLDVTLLSGRAVPLKVAGGQLWLAGADPGDERQMARAMDQVADDQPVVFLYHYPGGVFALADLQADVHLAGHIHGGQVALPFYGAIVTLSPYGKRFEHGLHQVQGTRLYVNRGIGMEGGRAPRVRIFARPEVTVIDLTPPPAAPGSAR